ncbi:hypothetical protein Y032_0004g2160 [Ancylostoma ceylanicum]|uniref:CC domain-containing protein n=1 Tax=Ancylostoma ceylanicum TaxID=53326 RepID=A0A016VVV6_9BILA|nr:hypothetical protein Y032_0004g2160 [Ancylostoma ceylanicum]
MIEVLYTTACGPCINCGGCALSCSTTYTCRSFHRSLSCVSGCCTTPTIVYSPPVIAYPSVSLMTTTQCVGPCVNSMCPSGFTCTAASVCCAFGK